MLTSHDVAGNFFPARIPLFCAVYEFASTGTLRPYARAPALAALRAGFAEVDLTAYLGVFTASDLRELITTTAA